MKAVRFIKEKRTVWSWCIFNQLEFVRRLLGRPLPGYGVPRVLLPWACLQELDHIKNSRKSKSGHYRPDTVVMAARAIRMINERLADPASGGSSIVCSVELKMIFKQS